jgi:serine/threonine-protein kinase
MTGLEYEYTKYRSGTLIGDKYRLLRTLGEGAMGWVWLARHIALGAPVALKIVKPDTASDPLHEARTTAGLHHPSIVSVFDSGCTQLGDPFFVMEHLDGQTLAEVLDRDGPLPATAAASLLLPVLDALEFCHERGVVHRNLKPSNIFLARLRGRTQAKLLDFGIAKPLTSPRGRPVLAGTHRYMAPEQGPATLEVDHRADLRSFCAVLYEAVAGYPPIEGRYSRLLTASAEPVVPPLRERRGAITSLWPILEKGLRQAARRDRFLVARDLRDALAGWLSGGTALELVEPSPRARPRRHLRCRELRNAS